VDYSGLQLRNISDLETATLCQTVFLFFFLYLSLSLSLSLFVSVSVSLCLSLYLSVSMSLSLSVTLSVSITLSLSMSLSLCLSLFSLYYMILFVNEILIFPGMPNKRLVQLLHLYNPKQDLVTNSIY